MKRYLGPNNQWYTKKEYLVYLEDCARRWEALNQHEHAQFVRDYKNSVK